jgi:polar amino acid transport system substrate-binding protein
MARDLVFVCVLLCSAMAGNACVLRLAYDIDPTPPFTVGVGQVTLERPGITVELIRQSAAKIQCDVELIRMPALRAQEWVQQGAGEGAFPFSYSAKGAESFAYPQDGAKPDRSRRVGTLSYVVYVLQESALNWDGQQFTNLLGPVAVNFGWPIANDLRAAGVKVMETYSSQEAMRDLSRGRVAAYVTLAENGDNAIARAGLEGIRQLSVPFVSKDFFLVFNRDFYTQNSAQVEKLWDVIGSNRDETTRLLMPRYQFNAE